MQCAWWHSCHGVVCVLTTSVVLDSAMCMVTFLPWGCLCAHYFCGVSAMCMVTFLPWGSLCTIVCVLNTSVGWGAVCCIMLKFACCMLVSVTIGCCSFCVKCLGPMLLRDVARLAWNWCHGSVLLLNSAIFAWRAVDRVVVECCNLCVMCFGPMLL